MRLKLNYNALHQHYTLLIYYAMQKTIPEMSYFRIQSKQNENNAGFYMPCTIINY